MNVVGIIPAAGRGKRLGNLPLSKEILPLGYWPEAAPESSRSRVASHYLLGHMRDAGVRRVYMAIASDKVDIVSCLGGGADLGVDLAYRVLDDSPGTPFTVDSLYPFVSKQVCALGFPDIIFEESGVYSRLLRHLQESSAEVVLGLFPAEQPEMVDMVAFNERTGRVSDLFIKPVTSDLRYTWGAVVWRADFTAYMHDFLAGALDDPARLADLLSAAQGNELYMGDVIQSALRAGLGVEAVIVSGQPYLDIGTPLNLRRAMQLLF